MKSAIGLTGNTAWAVTGFSLYLAGQWGILIILAQCGSPEMVGEYALALAICAPLIMFSNLRLRHVLSTDSGDRHGFGHYLSLRVIITLMSLLTIFLIGHITQSDEETAFVICVLGMTKALEAVSDIFHGLQQKHERMKYVAISLSTKAGISLLVFWVTIHFTHRLLLGCLSLTAAWGMVLFAYDIPMAKRTGNFGRRKSPDTDIGFQSFREKAEGIPFSDLKRLAWLSLPLGVVALLSSLGANVPRYFVDIYLGKAQLGIFAGMAYIIYAGHYLVNSAGHAVIPRMARYFDGGEYRSYRHLLFWSLALVFSFGFLIIFVSFIFGRTLLGFFYGPIFAEYVTVFVLLSIAGALEYINLMIWHGVTASRHFRVQPVAFGIHVVAISLFCFFLIPHYSLAGAGYSLIFSNLIQFVIAGSILALILGRASRKVGELAQKTVYEKYQNAPSFW